VALQVLVSLVTIHEHITKTNAKKYILRYSANSVNERGHLKAKA